MMFALTFFFLASSSLHNVEWAVAASTGGAVLEKLGDAVAEKPLPSIALTNWQDIQYTCVLGIGNPRQAVVVIVDTGSDDLLVPSVKCVECDYLLATGGFNHSQSSTYTSFNPYHEHDKFGWVNETMRATVFEGEDNISLGDLNFPQVGFHEVVKERTKLQGHHPLIEELGPKDNMGGIMGLGPGLDSLSFANTFRHTVNVFALYFTSGGRAGSTLVLGGSNSSFHTGPLTYVSVSNQTAIEYVDEVSNRTASSNRTRELKWLAGLLGPFVERKVQVFSDWTILAEDIKVGGWSLNSYFLHGKASMIVDSGTSLIAGPAKVMNSLIKLIGNVSLDCSNVRSLPTLTFTFDGRNYDLEPEFYVIRTNELSADNMLFLRASSVYIPAGSCLLALEAIPGENGGSWILGLPFLRKYYSVWDFDQRRIGFATANAPRPFQTVSRHSRMPPLAMCGIATELGLLAMVILMRWRAVGFRMRNISLRLALLPDAS